MITNFSLIHTAILIIVYLLLRQFNAVFDEKVYFFSSLIAGMEIILMVWAIKKIFFKKSIALAASVIVFKYAFLIFLFFYFRGQFQGSLGVFFGILTIMPTTLLFALSLKHFKLKSE
jgi:hypothetical protein